jgi:phospholipid/cholesterol/gamma-HCH transport system ATP-binding protein
MSERSIIECEGLDVGYGGTPNLQGVNLSIERGQVVAIVGGSGSGKSTLLKALIGLLPPMAGTVRLFGEDLYGSPADERVALRRRIGMLFQHGALFGSSSVLENVMFPLRELTDLPRPIMIEMARMKLALVELSDFEDRYPNELSGGQRKRVALARASVLDPEIVFCDEPTSGLDPVTAATIDETLLRFRDIFGITVVAVTHDITAVQRIADCVFMIGHGGISARGSVDDMQDSDDPDVHALFHRIPRPNGAPSSSRQGR